MVRIVRTTPCFSQRRPQVNARAARQSGRLSRFSRRDSTMSSISAMSGYPPTAANAAWSTKIAWSPVAMPVAREQVHHRGDQREERMPPGNTHVEAAPGAPAAREPIEDQPVGVRGKLRVG